MADDAQSQFTGTRPVAPQHAFDVAKLAAFMREHVRGFEGELAVEQFKGGQSNPTFLLTAGGQRYVLRRKPPGTLLPSAHAVEREYRVIAALAATEVPVARALALCEDPAVIGSAFYVMDCVDGRILWDPTLPGMGAAERAAHYDEMNRVIAALHRVEPAAIGLADYGKPGHYIERQVARWTRQYRAAETERIEAVDALIDWLPRHVPPAARCASISASKRCSAGSTCSSMNAVSRCCKALTLGECSKSMVQPLPMSCDSARACSASGRVRLPVSFACALEALPCSARAATPCRMPTSRNMLKTRW